MATLESQIYVAMAARLGQAGLSQQIVFPNEPEPTNLVLPYLRVDYLPNVTQRREIESNGLHEHMGIFQIMVVWGVRKSLTGPLDVANQLCELFPADLPLAAGSAIVRVTKRPDVGPMVTQGDQVSIPVSVEYSCWA